MACCFTACIDDGFTTSPSDILAFSTDTVNFDTIFTEQGTATRTLKVYNRSDKSLKISSINLAKGSASGFIVNVDGLSGTSFNDTEIRGQDSLYIFIIANVAATGNALPVENRDSLIFVTNGVRQEVKLLAQTQDAKRLRGITINSDSLLTAEKPFIIYDSLVVAPGVTLTIEPGATLYFNSNAFLAVKGRLLAEGTREKGITLHVMLRGTTWGVLCDSTDTSRTTLSIHNSIIHNATKDLLTAQCNRLQITNSEFSDAGHSVIVIHGGTAEFTHCTIVNYYFYDIITGATIQLPSIEETQAKGISAAFNNCLIAGNATPISEGDLTGTQIYFNSCMLNVEGADDNNFINTYWGGQPHFMQIDRENYLYDYRIGSAESSAIGWGDPGYATPPLDCDMYGVSRSEHVDVGAYQYVANEENE